MIGADTWNPSISSMRIVYVYQYFSTPKGSWGTRAYEFGRRWVEMGHEVTVVTSVYDKSDLQPRGLIDDFEVEGIQVRVVNVRLSNKHGFFKRTLTFIQFLFLAGWIALRTPADVVIASSGPLTVGILGLFASLLGRRKFVFEMRDLFSEGVKEIGAVKSHLLYRCINGLEVFLCRRADAVIALSPGIAEWVEARCPSAAVTVVPNVANNDLFGALHAARGKRGGPLRAVFTGTIGVANNCRLLLDAAEELDRRQLNGVEIELIGDGKERASLEREASIRRLRKLRFRDLMPKVELAKELATADIALLVLQPTPVFDTASPNKLFDAFAAGLPVIQTTQGWIKDLLEKEKCGLTVPGDDANALADAIVRLAGDPELRSRMGENGRRLAQEDFDRNILADRMLARLRSLVKPPSRPVQDAH